MRTESLPRAIDAVVRLLADVQHGVVARWQLIARGVSPDAIGRRIRDGRLIPLHRGVYLVGHVARAPLALEAAAVLACGPGAILSHRSAAKLHGLLEYPDPHPPWVTICRGDRSARPGLVVKRAALSPADTTTYERIPITTPARTILDCAAILSPERIEQLCAEAHVLRLAANADLRDQIERNPGRRGVARLRAVLDRAAPPARTRSELERRLLRLVRDSGLPWPETNQVVGGFEVDFLWRDARLIVETDGRAYHSHFAAQRRDREKTNRLQTLGFTVLRFTWQDVTQDADAVVAAIRAALAD